MAGEETDLREAEIGRIVNDYLDRKGRGEAISEAELLEAHPQLAADLASHFELVHNMVPGLGGQVQDSQASPGLPSDSLPGYQILSEIHRGGQGVVYQALQKGTRRKVAVKVMREGPFAGWRDRARFDREIQILGSLRHPHIVSIYDSGVVDGSHFFVMDYVSGQPLDLWASSGPRTVEQVLELFVKICDAINTAHLRGIVHRDLKPGNIRIGPDGEPHVLDFGLAKVSSECEPDGPTMTTTGQFVGSLPWSSPEQAQGLSDQIDTRTDVYALGVVLYQLLTGRFPYEVVGAMRDVLNRIVNAEPARPSGIRSTIDGEVETILLKCLAKEPARRYQTAGELGRDLERYLRGEPITAKSDSTLYVLGKTLRRHRAAVGAAMSFVLLLTVALIASTVLWRVAEQRADELNRTAYVHRIALAQNACEKDLLSRALQVLNECSPEFRDWEWYHLRRRATRSPLLTFRAHDKPIKCLAVSPDGKYVATGSEDKCLSVWESLTGRLVGRPLLRPRTVVALAFSPDSTRLVAATEGQDLVCVETPSTEVLWSKEREDLDYAEAPAVPASIVFTPDGKQVIVGGTRGTVVIVEVATGIKLLNFEPLVDATEPVQSSSPDCGIQCLAISPDGRLACGEFRPQGIGRSRVAMLDAAKRRVSRSYPLFPNSVLSLAFSPDGKRLACGGRPTIARGDAEDTLKVIDPETGDVFYSTRGHAGEVTALAFSPDGQILASAGVPRATYKDSPDNTLKLWDSRTGELKAAFSAHVEGATGVGWLPDGRMFVSAGKDGLVKVWSRQVAEDHLVLRDHRGLVQHVAFSPDGTRLASLCVQNSEDSTDGNEPDNSLRIWDAADGSLQLVIEPGHQLRSLAWSPDGKQVAAIMGEQIRFWNSRTGTEKPALQSRFGAGHDLAYSPDGRYLAGVFKTGVAVWAAADLTPVMESASGEILYRTEFSPDSRLLAVGQLHNGAIRLIDPTSGRERGLLRTDLRLSTMEFTPDSKRLICGHFNGSIGAWDVRSLDRIGLVCPSAGRRIQAIAVSPDGSRFASVGADMLLRVWDTETLREVVAMQAHDGQVMGVHFSPDGKRIATCALDGLVKIWESDVDEPLKAASQPALADGAGME